MARSLRFSQGALDDIEVVLRWTCDHFGEQQAIKYSALIRKAISEIQARPEMILFRPRPEIHPDARIYHLSQAGKAARHFFIFRFESDSRIVVDALVHDSKDLARHMFREYGPGAAEI